MVDKKAKHTAEHFFQPRLFSSIKRSGHKSKRSKKVRQEQVEVKFGTEAESVQRMKVSRKRTSDIDVRGSTEGESVIDDA